MTATGLLIEHNAHCSCGAVLAAFTQDPDGQTLPPYARHWKCLAVLVGLPGTRATHDWNDPSHAMWERKRNAPCTVVPVEESADVSVFDPGDVVAIRPEVLPQPTPISALTRAGIIAWPPEMTVERVRPLGAGQFALQFDGIPGQWLSTAFRRVETPEPDARREIVGTPPARRAVALPHFTRSPYLRLYSHDEILREAGKVLTTEDFDLLIDRLSAL